MKNKILIIIFIIVATITLLFARTKYSDYNLEKTVSACVMAKKQTSKSFDQEKAKKHCEEAIKKQLKKQKLKTQKPEAE